MHCEQVQPNLLDYSRKLLSGPESEQIKAHLSECAECMAVLREETALFKRLARLPEEEPCNDVWALVRSRTKPSRVRPLVLLHGLVATTLRKAATASVALALLAIGLYNVVLVNPQPTNPPGQKIIIAVYSDDPIGGHTDAVIDSIDDM
jgi:anti-sigma factor RsiW